MKKKVLATACLMSLAVIKERKKAEIEAKKAAIRAEDIAKGVFVPVSSLPQREPMKGVQTA